ncbi:bacillithiol system redox-active protein YtxJ [Cohnella faecalis]|uniref:Bacillithiol system redox-active protein YtxJ n=1 Tax=Cohnella faecalis TaxID=2315694 RepID=A0A398CP54_9BACL|nr:bacillithiol system redox-active protein YtxJ [Cohnella faecalis]RIE04353.1 bacillithiol system redox-active protein YtxJ [Cohnella faecalis]
MADIKQFTTLEQWNEALGKTSEKPLLIFKHSTSCSVSAGAHEELLKYVSDYEASDVDFAIVHVIEDRPVSNEIAEKLDVQHKSPQAILVDKGNQVWNESHWRITYSFLADKLGNPT